MSALWLVVSVYMCGYSLTACTVASDLYHEQETDPELAAARDEHPGFALACLIVGTIRRATIWPVYVFRPWWWRTVLGLQ